MTYRIVVGVDGSDGSRRAIELVAALPVRPHDEVIAASAIASWLRYPASGPLEGVTTAARERAEAYAGAAAARLEAAGICARAVVGAGDDALDALMRVVEDERAALIVVGSRGRGPWSSIVLGSTARALAITSPTPVFIARTSTVPTRVLVACDGSSSSRAALSAFAAMPQSEGAAVELLHVLPRHDWGNDTIDWRAIGQRTEIERAEKLVAVAMLEGEKQLLPQGIDSHVRAERGHPGETILRRAGEIGADLIVVGTQGLRGRRQFFFGSTAERVLTATTANVLVSQPPADR